MSSPPYVSFDTLLRYELATNSLGVAANPIQLELQVVGHFGSKIEKMPLPLSWGRLTIVTKVF